MCSICILKVRPQSESQRNIIMWEALQRVCLANLHIQNGTHPIFASRKRTDYKSNTLQHGIIHSIC